MTLAQSTRYTLHQPVVSTSLFLVSFPIFNTDDMEVFVDGVETELFSVSATFVGGRSEDASITLVTSVTDVDVEIYGARSPRREDDYLDTSPNLARNLQNDADTLTAVQQEQARAFSTSLKVSPQSPQVTPLAGSAADRASRVPVFSADGTALEIGPSASEIAGAQSYSEAAVAAQVVAVEVLADFDDRYLGSKASDPALGNDGEALAEGALYFNKTSKVMMVFPGALPWQPAFDTSAVLQRALNLSDVVDKPAALSNIGGLPKAGGAMAGALIATLGSEAAPAIAFLGELASGFYWNGGRMKYAHSGALALRFDPDDTDALSAVTVMTRRKTDARYAALASAGLLKVLAYASIEDGGSAFSVGMQGGFASMSRTGTGNYSFVFETARAVAINYIVVAQYMGGTVSRTPSVNSRSTTGFDVHTRVISSGGSTNGSFQLVVYEVAP